MPTAHSRPAFRTRSRLLLPAAAAVAAAALGAATLTPVAEAAPRAAAAAWDTDLAAGAATADPGAATSSGATGGDTAAGAFDGDAGTRWTSEAAADAWIAIDLGEELRITGAGLSWDTAFGTRYVLEVSDDGDDWRTFYTENAGTGGDVAVHTYPQDVVGRYVRLRGIEPTNGRTYALKSFQVFGGTPAPASTTRTDLALNHPAFSNVYQDANTNPARATDGGYPDDLRADASRWASDWSADRWISVDLGATSTISDLDLYWQAAYAVDYRIQVSDDNRNWTTVWQPSATDVEQRRANVQSPGDATGLHDHIDLPSPATGRYVRMLGVERRSFYNPAPATAQFGYSLYEFQVWGTGGDGGAAYPALPSGQGGDYRTVFQDDFDGAALDRGKWRAVTTGATMDPVNGESQAYVDSPDTIAVGDGTLKLKGGYCKGCTTTPKGQVFDFSSGRVDTHTKLDFTYGRVSARLRMPVGDGFWPAFWLLGSDVDDPAVSWPASGETDIMENIGYPDWTSSALHGPGYSADGNIGATQDFPAGEDVSGWHTYTAEWTPTGIRFLVDDRLVTEVLRQQAESTRGKWVFDHDQYLILNLALGGAYPAGWNQVTDPYWGLPQSSVDKVAAGGVQLEVDWVKVEQKG
ncbi:discoidin domain-containing protein [Streptomyces sp. NPDC050560]|uniref:discoidin domain-containing protein n=1 Tax=Streptomyces sp. NPDC050560 TaxID=3365630 RepID=UPI0037B2E72F